MIRLKIYAAGVGLVMAFAMLGMGELAARTIASAIRGDLRPFCYGSVELHRLLFEDKSEILRKQGTFFSVVPATYDSLGGALRGRYFTFKKPPGRRRILVFGGSAVYSVTTAGTKSFPAVLEHLLNATDGSLQFEVLNMGEPGANSERIRQIQQDGFQFEHSLELFYHLSNDFLAPAVIHSRPELIVSKVYNSLYRMSVLFSSLQRLVMKFTKTELNEEDVNRLYQRYRYNVEEMLKACQERNIPAVIIKQPLDLSYISTTDSRYRIFVNVYRKALAALDELAGQYGVGIIDATTILHTSTPWELSHEIFYDHVHLTEKGNAIVAEIVYRGLLDLQPEFSKMSSLKVMSPVRTDASP